MTLVPTNNGMKWGLMYGLSTAMVVANATQLLNVTGDKLAIMGRVQLQAMSGTKNITRVWFAVGTIIKAGGSGYIISLQDWTTSGPSPYRPDEVQDQTVSLLASDGTYTSSAWYRTGAFSANRTVAHGERLAIVFEFDGSGRLGSDQLAFTSIFAYSNHHAGGTAKKASGTWSSVIDSSLPNVMLEFTDGSFGTLTPGFPSSSYNTHAINSGTSPDEIALEFRFPIDCTVDGISVYGCHINNTGTIDFILYDASNTVLASVTVNQATINTNNASRGMDVKFPKVSITANTVYRAAVKPGAPTVTLIGFNAPSVAAMQQTWIAGDLCCFAQRTDAGAWTTIATRRVPIHVHIAEIDVDTAPNPANATFALGARNQLGM